MKFNSTLFSLAGFTMFSQFIFLSLSMPYFYGGGELSLEWEAFVGQGWVLTMLILIDFMSVVFLSTVLLISGGGYVV